MVSPTSIRYLESGFSLTVTIVLQGIQSGFSRQKLKRATNLKSVDSATFIPAPILRRKFVIRLQCVKKNYFSIVWIRYLRAMPTKMISPTRTSILIFLRKFSATLQNTLTTSMLARVSPGAPAPPNVVGICCLPIRIHLQSIPRMIQRAYPRSNRFYRILIGGCLRAQRLARALTSLLT